MYQIILKCLKTSQIIQKCPKASQIVQKPPKLSQDVQKCPKGPTVDGRLYKVDSRQSTIEMSPKQKKTSTEISQKQKLYQNSHITKTKMSPLVFRTSSGYSEFDTDCLGLVYSVNFTLIWPQVGSLFRVPYQQYQN